MLLSTIVLDLYQLRSCYDEVQTHVEEFFRGDAQIAKDEVAGSARLTSFDPPQVYQTRKLTILVSVFFFELLRRL